MLLVHYLVNGELVTQMRMLTRRMLLAVRAV